MHVRSKLENGFKSLKINYIVYLMKNKDIKEDVKT